MIEVTSPGDSGHIREAIYDLGMVMKRWQATAEALVAGIRVLGVGESLGLLLPKKKQWEWQAVP